MLEVRVISMGTLAHNHLWNERSAVRTGHATTTIVRTGNAILVVNPGLPAQILAQRLSERTTIKPEEVTHLFVTAFTPDHLRGWELFPRAARLIHAAESAAAAEAIQSDTDVASRSKNAEDLTRLDMLARLLQQFDAADDQILPGVDLFPLPGVTPGTCGILVAQTTTTLVIAGDAVATIDHLERGQVLSPCHDLEAARESLREVIEIADVIIPGRDGLTINPTRTT